jgi:hypothetical protein
MATQIPKDRHITYQLQYRKCGKLTCSTCHDGQGHGPYWYAYWHEGARMRSGYIGKISPGDAGTTTNPSPASSSSHEEGTGYARELVNTSHGRTPLEKRAADQ